ncbi:MAG: autotransporter-associated beta strand repeat-containing protein [Candidatus Udaeobacter sp.]
MRKFKRRQRHSLAFGLFLAAVVGALLLPAALAPRANAGPTDYWDFEDPLGLRPRPAPELFSQPQGALINQPLASNYNPTLALNFASGAQPGAFQPLVPDANASWIGGVSSNWSFPGNWTAGGPPGAGQIASFDANSTGTDPPQIDFTTTVGELHMATGVHSNITLSASGASFLTIGGVGGIGILVDNSNIFSFTISAPLVLGAAQAWTNNSSNLFTVSGGVALSGDNLTVNGTGNTLISGNIAGAGAGSILTKDGNGTLTLTGTEAITGGITVNGGTLLMNTVNTSNQPLTVNNAGTTLGGTGTIGGSVSVGAGANLAPGNGGNTAGTLTMQGPLTLASGSNFRVDINGTTAGTFDQVVVNTSTVTIGGSNLVVHVGTTLSLNQTFQILTVGSGSAISGTFAGIPQGGHVTADNGTVFSVSYIGGSGNDIVLTVVAAPVPEASTWMGGALAIAGLAFTQRRRLRKLIVRRCAVGS